MIARVAVYPWHKVSPKLSNASLATEVSSVELVSAVAPFGRVSAIGGGAFMILGRAA